MKKIVETNTKYECEKCGTLHWTKESALDCEKRHTCQHQETRSYLKYDNDNYGDGGDIFLKSVCTICNYEIKTINLSELTDNQMSYLCETISKVIEDFPLSVK